VRSPSRAIASRTWRRRSSWCRSSRRRTASCRCPCAHGELRRRRRRAARDRRAYHLSLLTEQSDEQRAVARPIEAIVGSAPGFVIIDEAYVDFAGVSAIDLLARSPRLVIARTFSKAFGLAGLARRYALAAPDVVTELEKARGPYKVSAVGADAARVALHRGHRWVRDRAARAIEARETLRAQLARRGIETPVSRANFVFARIPDATAVAQAMRSRGVAVRPFANLPVFGDA